MKPYINFLILIVAAIGLYTVYGMATFQVDEPRPFVFNEPKLPPEMILMDETNTPEAKQKTIAVEEAQKALSYYKDTQKNLPQQANDTMALLMDRMVNSDLPLYFLSTPSAQKSGLRSFQTLNINTDNILEAGAGKSNLNCSSKTPVSTIMLGTAGKDTISCDAMRDTTGLGVDPDYVFIGGPENDVITDAVGNRIVNGGTGDDIIKLGAGRSIIVLDSSWGKDTLSIDCTGSVIAPNEIPTGFSIPWVYKSINFIVLANSLNPKDIELKGNVLTNVATGDTLTINQDCFTVVPSIK